MTTFPIHTLQSALPAAQAPLQSLNDAFGMLPNLLGAMATSPNLIKALAGLFGVVHAGSFSEADIQILLLTNAVANKSPWPVAFHSTLALQQGIGLDDIDAIRTGNTPADPRYAALSTLAKTLIAQRGHLASDDTDRFLAAGFEPAHLLEVIAVTAASTITNYTASVTNPPVDAQFAAFIWKAPQ